MATIFVSDFGQQKSKKKNGADDVVENMASVKLPIKHGPLLLTKNPELVPLTLTWACTPRRKQQTSRKDPTDHDQVMQYSL